MPGTVLTPARDPTLRPFDGPSSARRIGAFASALSGLRRLLRNASGQKREHPRTTVSARAALHASGAVQLVQVRDASVAGVGFDALIRPQLGAEILLEILDLPGRPTLTAIVRHVSGMRVGAEWRSPGETAHDVAEKLFRLHPSQEPTEH